MKEEAGGQVYAGDAIRALLGVGVVQEHHLHTERRGEGRPEEDAIYTVVCACWTGHRPVQGAHVCTGLYRVHMCACWTGHRPVQGAHVCMLDWAQACAGCTCVHAGLGTGLYRLHMCACWTGHRPVQGAHVCMLD